MHATRMRVCAALLVPTAHTTNPSSFLIQYLLSFPSCSHSHCATTPHGAFKITTEEGFVVCARCLWKESEIKHGRGIRKIEIEEALLSTVLNCAGPRKLNKLLSFICLLIQQFLCVRRFSLLIEGIEGCVDSSEVG